MDQSLADQIRESRRLLKNPYAYLDDEGGFSAISSVKKPSFSISSDIILNGKRKGQRFSKTDIERFARNLQAEMWRNRSQLFPDQTLTSPIDILDPIVAFKCLGYSVNMQDTLGQYKPDGAELCEVAGSIDTISLEVAISRKPLPNFRNFTAAHELGHAILHEGVGFHRDRALDGSGGGASKAPMEYEADTFAAFFLMPEKQIRKAFEERFLTQEFRLNDTSAFALAQSLEEISRKLKTRRDLSQYLARVTRYNRVQFISLADQFNVSVDAMAIRLEELELV
ncbi:ImmA/IrrE family metallo-endopeptidase [Hahella sp. HN01]|uniref:ImmA/IrrE family metallo-endopeptidase n=1 Tax=Hahella sp. HN01 TaxID=2847262 RepID=UPI001C1F0D18|nr:ImmA/IrrE family metallo-endopeptidase [Hahella sp. HN01]MBU6951278.1 ImmA/IrrE family metallo-endopeptidase [Hahella sp. HN01]